MSRMPDHFSAVTAVHDALWAEWERLAKEDCPSCAAEEARQLTEPVLATEIRKAKAEGWDECVDEAEGCGWIYDPVAPEMYKRNPYAEETAS